ncbi:uncharacterized protein TRAVEDRAFT_32475, partial [Trametes versicolor FP-101664 SS1]
MFARTPPTAADSLEVWKAYVTLLRACPPVLVGATRVPRVIHHSVDRPSRPQDLDSRPNAASDALADSTAAPTHTDAYIHPVSARYEESEIGRFSTILWSFSKTSPPPRSSHASSARAVWHEHLCGYLEVSPGITARAPRVWLARCDRLPPAPRQDVEPRANAAAEPFVNSTAGSSHRVAAAPRIWARSEHKKICDNSAAPWASISKIARRTLPSRPTAARLGTRALWGICYHAARRGRPQTRRIGAWTRRRPREAPRSGSTRERRPGRRHARDERRLVPGRARPPSLAAICAQEIWAAVDRFMWRARMKTDGFGATGATAPLDGLYMLPEPRLR